jgi:polyhydroxybutyrate depolymerase
MAQVEANHCVDEGKVFAAGTSSGAWLSNYLACARGNVIRGTAADPGGLQFAHGTCTGGAAVMEFPSDSTNPKDQEGNEIGSAAARDLFVKLSGCSTTPTTMAFDKGSTCQVCGACASPVVWCNVGGGRQSGNGDLSPSGWALWSTLKSGPSDVGTTLVQPSPA